MAGYNRIIMIGNLTRDPDYKQLGSGQAVCKLGLASNRQFKNKQSGSMVQEVCYIDVDVWGPQAESCKNYLQKGRPVLIEGRIKFDSWEDTNGQTRSKHSIVADRVVFLGGAGAQDDAVSTKSDTEEPSAFVEQPRLDPNNAKERDILAQIEQLKNKKIAPAKKSGVKKGAEMMGEDASTGSGEISFKDEPPFQDDLPF